MFGVGIHVRLLLLALGVPPFFSKQEFGLASALTGVVAAQPSPNLVLNPSFERTVAGSGDPSDWSMATDVYSRSTVGCRGNSAACLHWHGTDPKVYHMTTQSIKAVHPGVPYVMSASIRTENLTSSNGGYASITGSWSHPNGKYYGGTWPVGPHGTTDGWKNVTETFSMPTDAKPGSFVIAVYVRATTPGDPVPTGDAWFDDISVKLAPKPLTPCPVMPPPPPSGNLVRNPDFLVVGGTENAPCEWGGINGVWSRSTIPNTTLPGVPSSLAFHGTDPSVYKLVSQNIPSVVPGVSYSMGAYVKTVNITGSGGYASITASWVIADPTTGQKKYDGSWPEGPSGSSNGWVKVGGGVNLPANAQPGSFAVHLYVRPFLSGDPTPTGRAFFDNISVVHVPPRALRSTLISPVYRGQMSTEGSPPVLVRARFIFDAATSEPRVAVHLELRSRPDGKILWQEAHVKLVTNTSAPLDLNVSALMKASNAPVLPPGKYALFVSCLNVTSPEAREPMAIDVHNLTVLTPSTPPPAVAIDQELRVILNGSLPFYPIGFIGFCTTLRNVTQMRAFRPAGFNSIMPYGECTTAELDEAHAADVKVAFSLKDIFVGKQLHYKNQTLTNGAEEEEYFRERVSKFRKHRELRNIYFIDTDDLLVHSAALFVIFFQYLQHMLYASAAALLCWYLNDEIHASDPRLLTHQQWAIEEDPSHPTWQVVTAMQPADLGTSDAFGVDSYPIGYIGENASSERRTVVATNQITESSRPVWHAIQTMNWRDYSRPECKRTNNTCHTPTYKEVRSMVWITVAGGAQGVFFYSIYDIEKNPDIGFSDEWNVLSKVAREVERFAPILLSASLRSPMVDGGHPSWLMLRTHQANTTSCYVFAVSDGRGGGFVTLRPVLPSASLRIAAVMVESDEEDGRAHHVTVRPDGVSFSSRVDAMAMVAFHIMFV